MRALLLALCVATAARGAEPTFDAPEPPPAVYGPLVWLHNGSAVRGYWVTEKETQRLQVRLDQQQAQIDYLTDRAAKECTTETQAANRAWVGSQSSLWIVAGAALLVGIAGGVYAAKKL